jgi:hypothetical protein
MATGRRPSIHILIALAVIITVWNLLAGQRRAA